MSQQSSYLDQMAREAGVAIQRYQNPIDLEKTKQLQSKLPNTKPPVTVQSSKIEIVEDKKPTSKFKQKFQKAISLDDEEEGNIVIQPKLQQQKKIEIVTPEDHKLQTKKDNNNKTKQQETTTKDFNYNLVNKDDFIRPFNPNDLPNVTALDQAYEQTNSNDNNQIEEEFSYEERQKKITEFFDIIEQHLAPQLRASQTAREATGKILHDIEQLQATIKALQLSQAAGQKTMEAKVDIGCKFLADGKFINNNKIVINMGLNLWSEMSYDEALKYLQQRHTYLISKLDRYEDQCCLWSARIKAMHEAIGVLSEITEKEEQEKQQRQISFGL